MDISIIIVNYNVYNDVLICIGKIKETLTALKYEIIVVDNNSSDRSIEKILSIYPDIKLILNTENSGYGFANNLGMKVSTGKYFLLVNPDIIVSEHSIENLYNFMENEPKAGSCGPVQSKPSDGIEHYYTFFPSLYSRLMQEFRLYMTAPVMKQRFFNFIDDNFRHGKPFKVDWIMGSCLMVRSEIFKKLGGFDEAFFLYEEETEWQYRMSKEGWSAFMIPDAKVLHNHHSSASKLGTLFVNYQEFRSRIIFDTKRFRGLTYLIRQISIISALLLRIFYFFPKALFNKNTKRKYIANKDLLNFSLKRKEDILIDRYNFDNKLYLFK